MKAQPQIIHPAKPISISTDKGLVQQFFEWTDRMNYYRVVILAGMIMLQTCITAPAVLYTMHFVSGFNDLQAYIVILGLFSVLVTNLAVQPMRVTIPLFIIASVAQIAVTVVNLIALL